MQKISMQTKNPGFIIQPKWWVEESGQFDLIIVHNQLPNRVLGIIVKESIYTHTQVQTKADVCSAHDRSMCTEKMLT